MKCVELPMVNGRYQNITEEKLKDILGAEMYKWTSPAARLILLFFTFPILTMRLPIRRRAFGAILPGQRQNSIGYSGP